MNLHLKDDLRMEFIVQSSEVIQGERLHHLHHTPCLKKTKQICICQNFVKFLPILMIFGREMTKRLKLWKVHLFFTSA